MIIMRIKGGLGNQMFQYAAAYALSKRLQQLMKLDFALTRNMTQFKFKLNHLNASDAILVDQSELPFKIGLIKNLYINKLLRVLNLPKHKCGEYLYILETRSQICDELFTINENNLYLDGYFQSEKYFKEYREDLLKQFVPNYPAEQDYLQMLSDIQKCNAVAVHVRRGDFKKDHSSYHYLLEDAYYKRAIDYIRTRVENPVFFWFSNDFDWVKDKFGDEPDFRFVRINTTYGDIDDMMLMKNCNHIITANSTFSWWSAWLNEHEDCIRVVPEKKYGMDGMIPEDWIKLPIE